MRNRGEYPIIIHYNREYYFADDDAICSNCKEYGFLDDFEECVFCGLHFAIGKNL